MLIELQFKTANIMSVNRIWVEVLAKESIEALRVAINIKLLELQAEEYKVKSVKVQNPLDEEVYLGTITYSKKVSVESIKSELETYKKGS